MVAAMLAALMSSLSAVFNSSSTIFTMDFYKKWKPNASDREMVQIGRIATVVMVALSLAWIPFMSRISSQLYIYLQSVQAYIAPPIAAVFLFGVFWRRINATGALASLLTGFVFGTLRFILEIVLGRSQSGGVVDWFVRINFLHFSALMFVICVAVLIVVSLLTPSPSIEKVQGLTWQTVSAHVKDADVLVPIEAGGRMVRRLSSAAALVLIIVMISLWTYFA